MGGVPYVPRCGAYVNQLVFKIILLLEEHRFLSVGFTWKCLSSTIP